MERKSHLFFLRSEPGTGARLQKMWRENRTFFLRSEPGTGAGLQKMWRENRTFFGGLDLEQVLGYRKCGEKIALFLAVWTWNRCWVTENVERKSHFFGGLDLEQVLGYRKCGEKIALFLAV